MTTQREAVYEVGDRQIRVGRLSAMDQFHVARELQTVVYGLVAVREGSREAGEAPPGPREFSQAVCAMASDLPRARAENAIMTCLGCASQLVQDKAAPLVVAGRMMDESIEMPEMLEIAWRVIEHNGIVDFFAAPPSTSRPRGE